MRNLSKIIATLMASLFLLAFPSVANGSSIRRGEPPAHYADECPQKGTVKLQYDKNRKQHVNVYYPYGYEEDKHKRYDVFFMLHQAGLGDLHSWIDTPVESYFGKYPCSSIYDWMIYEELAEPFIVISINLVQGEDSGEDIRAALLWGAKNLRTYANTASLDGISAARRHFFVGGLSMGAWKTCMCMRDDFALFGNYILGYGGTYYEGAERDWMQYEEECREKLIKSLIVSGGEADPSFRTNEIIYAAMSKHSERHLFRKYPGGHGFAAAIPFMYNALGFIYEDYGRAKDIISGYSVSVKNAISVVYEKSFEKIETY